MPISKPQAASRSDRSARSALMDAAAERYARFGPRKTTMAEVARDAGFSRATVYKHFPSKDALYRALLDRATEGFLAEVGACIVEPGGAREKLRRIVEIAHRIYAHSPVLLGAAARDDDMRIESIAAEAIRRHEREVIDLLAEVLRAGVASGSIRPIHPERVAYLMYQLGNVLVIRELSGRRDFPLREILDAMDDLISLGLEPKARRPQP